jgi:hypothetical protein
MKSDDNGPLLKIISSLNVFLSENASDLLVDVDFDEEVFSDSSDKDRLKIAMSAFNEVKLRNDEMTGKLESLKFEVRNINDVILPKMESEKKSYASSKKFKEAAVVAKDIKDLGVKKEQLESEINVVETSISQLFSKIAECKENLYQCQNLIRNTLDKDNLQRFDILKARADKLLLQKLEILSLIQNKTQETSTIDVSVLNSIEEELDHLVEEMNLIYKKYPHELTQYVLPDSISVPESKQNIVAKCNILEQSESIAILDGGNLSCAVTVEGEEKHFLILEAKV